MRLARRHKRKAPFFSPPVVLETVPSALEGRGADGTGVLMPGQDTGFGDA